MWNTGLAGLYSFGFTDEVQFHRWFYDHDWLVAMHDAGMKLVVWDVQDGFHFHGDTQAIFRKDKATLVLKRELI